MSPYNFRTHTVAPRIESLGCGCSCRPSTLRGLISTKTVLMRRVFLPQVERRLMRSHRSRYVHALCASFEPYTTATRSSTARLGLTHVLTVHCHRTLPLSASNLSARKSPEGFLSIPAMMGDPSGRIAAAWAQEYEEVPLECCQTDDARQKRRRSTVGAMNFFHKNDIGTMS